MIGPTDNLSAFNSAQFPWRNGANEAEIIQNYDETTAQKTPPHTFVDKWSLRLTESPTNQ